MNKKPKNLRQVNALTIIIFLCSIFWLMPLVLIFINSFKPYNDMIQDLSRPFSIFKRNISRFQPHLPYSFRMSSKISPISQSCSPSFFQFFGMDRNSAFVYGCLRFLSS